MYVEKYHAPDAEKLSTYKQTFAQIFSAKTNILCTYKLLSNELCDKIFKCNWNRLDRKSENDGKMILNKKLLGNF